MKNNFYKKTDETNKSFSNETNYNTINELLESELQNNKHDNWNKIDKNAKMQKLYTYAEKYGKENNFSIKEIKLLKTFFLECLEKTKLHKTKEVICDKETKEIISIPQLHYNRVNSRFTLKVDDAKRVSTLKSLTPKRTITDKNRSSSTNGEVDEIDTEVVVS
jgi:hypothetical protein